MQYVVAALATASVYALIAMGITLIYGVARIMHVAHAIMFVLSSFLTFELVARGWPFGWATLASVLAVTGIGALLYVLLFDRVRDRPYGSLVVSLGLVVLGEAVLHLIWGIDVFQIEGPLSETRTLVGVSFTIGSVVAVFTAVVLVSGLALMLSRTEAGRLLRAVAENPAAATLLGVRARRVAFVVFVGGTAMAALAGSLIGTFVPFSSASADVFVLKAFAIAIVGGLGSPLGAVTASALFATVEIVPIALGQAGWSTPVLFMTMVVVLAVRPAGLFGTRSSHHTREDDALPAPRPVGTARAVRLRSLAAVVGAVIVLLVLPLLTSSDNVVGLAAYAMCLAIAAYAVWVPLHFLGVPSLAHAALCGIGAYVAGVVLEQAAVGIGPLLVYGALGATVVAFGLALVAMRSDSLPASAIITLALGGLVVSLISNLGSVTGGLNGLVVVKPLTVFGARFGVANSDLPIYMIGLAVVAVVLVAVWALEGSRRGNTLLAVRDNAVLAEAVGVGTFRLKVAVFTVSGALAGIAGVLYAYFSRFLEPATFDASLAINLLLAVLLGGSASKYGPVIGVSVFVFLPYVSPLTGPADLVLYGLVLIAFATFAPGGVPGLITGARRITRGPLRPAPAEPAPVEVG